MFCGEMHDAERTDQNSQKYFSMEMLRRVECQTKIYLSVVNKAYCCLLKLNK